MREQFREYKTKRGVDQFLSRGGFVPSEDGCDNDYDVEVDDVMYRASVSTIPGAWGSTVYLVSVVASE